MVPVPVQTRNRRRTRSDNTSDTESSSVSPSQINTSKRKKTRASAPSSLSPLLHRDKQVEQLSRVLQCRVPFVYVTGPPGSGKSTTVDHVVRELTHQLNIVTVDMRDVLKPQGFYHSVLSPLGCTAIPDHTTDFLRLLARHVSSHATGRCTLVVKHAPALNNLNSSLFASACKLNQLTNGKMVDVIGNYLYEKHRVTCSELDLATSDIVNYVRTCVIDTLSLYTNSLREMMGTADSLLPTYLSPLRAGDLRKTDRIPLFHRFQPALLAGLDQLSCIPKSATQLELPYNTRVLLVCAYLASHNPARLDKRFFCKGRSSRRKTKTRPGTKKLSEALKGPKTFPIDRLIAIFAAVTQDGSIPSSDILMSVSTLVSLNLIVRVSVDLLEQPKYKCLATMPTVQGLARESGIDFDTFYYNY